MTDQYITEPSPCDQNPLPWRIDPVTSDIISALKLKWASSDSQLCFIRF